MTENFRENDTEALKISKSPKFPKGDQTDKNFIAPLRMLFWKSNSTLNSLKRLFTALLEETVVAYP